MLNPSSAGPWVAEHPAESQELLDLLTTVVIDYLDAQIKAGVHMVQVFEAVGGIENNHASDVESPPPPPPPPPPHVCTSIHPEDKVMLRPRFECLLSMTLLRGDVRAH